MKRKATRNLKCILEQDTYSKSASGVQQTLNTDHCVEVVRKREFLHFSIKPGSKITHAKHQMQEDFPFWRVNLHLLTGR